MDVRQTRIRAVSILQIEPFRRVGAGFVQDDRYIVPDADERRITAPDNVTIVLFRLDNKQEFIHEACHSQCGGNLPQGRHIENDIIEIARSHVRHEIKEFFQAELRRTGVARSHAGQIQIVRR